MYVILQYPTLLTAQVIQLDDVLFALLSVCSLFGDIAPHARWFIIKRFIFCCKIPCTQPVHRCSLSSSAAGQSEIT